MQLISVSGTSNMRMVLTSIMSLVYTIAVISNILACLWFWIGYTLLDTQSWLSQEYSAPPGFPVAASRQPRGHV